VQSIIDIVRYSVFAVLVVAVIAAVGSWLVRTRRVSPFSPLGRVLRSTSDLVIAPVERQVVRRGGSPVHAGIWLVVAVAIAGIVLLALLKWVVVFVQQAYFAFTGGFWKSYEFVVGFVFAVMTVALFLRVIASWFGVFRYTWFMRPAYWMTDWIIRLVQRVLPPIGRLDVSPIVALLALWILKVLLLAVVPITRG